MGRTPDAARRRCGPLSSIGRCSHRRGSTATGAIPTSRRDSIPSIFSEESLDRVATDAPGFGDLIGEPAPYGGAGHRAVIAFVAPNSD